MNGRSFALAALGAVLVAGPVSAQERAPAQPQAAAHAEAARAPTVLASAADVKLPPQLKAQADAAPPAKRPRAARVTTCRCGDPSGQ